MWVTAHHHVGAWQVWADMVFDLQASLRQYPARVGRRVVLEIHLSPRRYPPRAIVHVFFGVQCQGWPSCKAWEGQVQEKKRRKDTKEDG